MKPKISIIVPIYNVEPYLSRCLDSLVKQTLQEIEIIAVNDGSTDKSLLILREYAEKDHRITVVDQKNAGVSFARNEGIQMARGEYIGFVDPDDWIDANMYEVLYREAVQEQAEIVMCGYMREFGTHAKEKIFSLPQKVTYRGEQVRTQVMRRLIGPLAEEMGNPELLDAWGTVWSKIYRADLVRKHGLEFVDLNKVGTNEDSLFNIYACSYATSFVFLNRPLYHYWRSHSGSVTSGFKPRLLEQWFTLYTYMEDFLNQKNLAGEYQLALKNRICLNILGLGLNTISPSHQAPLVAKVATLHSILNDQRMKRSFKQLEMKHFSTVWWTFYFCAKHRFALGLYVLLVMMDALRKWIR